MQTFEIEVSIMRAIRWQLDRAALIEALHNYVCQRATQRYRLSERKLCDSQSLVKVRGTSFIISIEVETG